MAAVLSLESAVSEGSLATLENARRLGEGGYSKVVEGTWQTTPVAVKQMDSHYGRKAYEREIAALAKVEAHPHVIRFITGGVVADMLWIVLELAETDLHRIIEPHMYRGIGETLSRAYFRQMLLAIAHVHSYGVVHRDIKLENWLVSRDVVKLADFGLAHCFRSYEDWHLLHDYVGSTSYLAPEVLYRHPHNGFRCDAWGVAVCLFAMVSGFFPYERAHHSDVRFATCFDHTDCLLTTLYDSYGKPCDLSCSVRDLLHRSLGIKARLDILSMQQHSWTNEDATTEVLFEDRLWRGHCTGTGGLHPPVVGRLKAGSTYRKLGHDVTTERRTS